MAIVRVAQPVQETRELLERLVRRLGHEVGDAATPAGADALLFEATSPECAALARSAAAAHPGMALIACSAFPVDPAALPAGTTTLTQPFAPAELARALGDALAAAA